MECKIGWGQPEGHHSPYHFTTARRPITLPLDTGPTPQIGVHYTLYTSSPLYISTEFRITLSQSEIGRSSTEPRSPHSPADRTSHYSPNSEIISPASSPGDAHRESPFVCLSGCCDVTTDLRLSGLKRAARLLLKNADDRCPDRLAAARPIGARM